MARTRKGRRIDGWVIVDKPAGMGSTDVVNRVRRAFQAQKAGHSGTLDPDATGLLAVALGDATKVIPYVMDALKAYDFTVRWGAATTTDDASGAVLATSDLRPDDAAIKAAIPAYLGEIMQVPPAFSAVRVAGARAYDLAREGETVELQPRPLWVEELLLTDRPDPDHARFEMTCGKGGYVRAIARDMGRDLGCLGHVTGLRRLWSGPFTLEQAVTMDQIESLAQGDGIDRLLLPLEAGLADLPEVRIGATELRRLKNGNAVAGVPQEPLDYGEECWASAGGHAVALGHWQGGQFQPARVLERAPKAPAP
ncbi:MAG: tRNA pseudouridine(55) synthase TruB [Rubellimicrobium sp.]|nr:tRNA pseudouridine(55) synthase TruB [Rubellimicrobium sp.]